MRLWWHYEMKKNVLVNDTFSFIRIWNGYDSSHSWGYEIESTVPINETIQWKTLFL